MYDKLERCEKMEKSGKQFIRKIFITMITIILFFSINLIYTKVYALEIATVKESLENSGMIGQWIKEGIYGKDPPINPQYYNPGNSYTVEGSDKLKDMANIIIGALQIIGTVLSVAVLGILGIKYMLGSVEERAEYKKSLRPYLIGAIMMFGITNILAIVIKIVGQIQLIV